MSSSSKHSIVRLEDEDSYYYDDDDDDANTERVGKGIQVNYTSWDMFVRKWMSHGRFQMYERNLWSCLQFCYLLPKNYDFLKDDMIQLWIAEGLIPSPVPPFEQPKPKMEEIARIFFHVFQLMNLFQSSNAKYSSGPPRHKLNDSIVDLLQASHGMEYFRIDDGESYISEDILHASFGDSIDPISLKNLYLAKNLCTLLILHESGFCFDQVPRELFLRLPLLRVLDLSYTSIMELPSSIGNLEHMRYINLSGTPLTTLPNALCSLSQLQTLKLRGCLKLASLPKDINKLILLRHLDVDVACLMVAMPPGLGNLTQLQTLPAFVVGKENGCHITELRRMRNNLRGTLRILRLENVYSAEDAREVALRQMQGLHKLELQWTQLQDGFEILENLRPPAEIRELQIVGYGGAMFPKWMDTSFPKLVTIVLHDCKKCELLPDFLGQLPSLKCLYLSDMQEIKKIEVRYFGVSVFPRLENFTINGMPKFQKWSGIEEDDFPLLCTLSISGCSKLTALPELSVLKSLQKLEINLCPLLQSFPKKGLPYSLEHLDIIDCPLLTKRCHKDRGPDWKKIEHIPNVWIDCQQIHAHKQVKVVFRFYAVGAKSRKRIMEAACSVRGIMSAKFSGAEKNLIVVEGEGIDPTCLTSLIEKKVGISELVSVTPIDEKKRDEKREDNNKVLRAMEKGSENEERNVVPTGKEKGKEKEISNET